MVGYKRRLAGERSTKSGRAVMGRKGIGKLSAFSLASIVEVHTVKNGKKLAFRMVVDEIRKRIAKELPYHPTEIVPDKNLLKGTKIVLTSVHPRRKIGPKALKRRLARRFGIVDGAHSFELFVNGDKVTLSDREYYDKFQYLWHYGDKSVATLAKNATLKEARPNAIVVDGVKHQITGWLASVKTRNQLKSTDEDNLNRIALMVRLKLAHEDLLEEFSEAGMYSKYLIGEIHADFLDLDDEDDIATSSREHIIEDDPRYEALKTFLKEQLNYIKIKWTEFRNAEGRDQALEIPEINRWYNSLSTGEQKKATSLLGKVNALPLDEPNDRRVFFKQAILAFEIYRVKRNLDALDGLQPQEILTVSSLFSDVEDIEATYYYEIVKQRVGVIEVMERLITDDAKETFLQKHVFDSLWLIEPSWERATEAPVMEKDVKKLLNDVNAKLPAEYKKGRVDIKYRMVSGRHVIIELKRASRILSIDELLPQIRKYSEAMDALLLSANRREDYEIIVLVGRDIKEWSTPHGRRTSAAQLAPLNARIIMYDELRANALSCYQEYLAKHKQANRLAEILASVDDADFFEKEKGLAIPGKRKAAKTVTKSTTGSMKKPPRTAAAKPPKKRRSTR